MRECREFLIFHRKSGDMFFPLYKEIISPRVSKNLHFNINITFSNSFSYNVIIFLLRDTHKLTKGSFSFGESRDREYFLRHSLFDGNAITFPVIDT